MGKLTIKPKSTTLTSVGTDIMKTNILPKSEPNRKFQLALLGLNQSIKQKRSESRLSPISKSNASSPLPYSERKVDEPIIYSSRSNTTSNQQQISFTRSSPKPSPPDTPGKASELADLSTAQRPYKASPLSQNNSSSRSISFVRSRLNVETTVSLSSGCEGERATQISKVKTGLCMRSISRLNDQLGKSFITNAKQDAPSIYKEPVISAPVPKEASVSRSSSTVPEPVTPHSNHSPIKSTVSTIEDILRSQALPLNNLHSLDRTAKRVSPTPEEQKKSSQSLRVNSEKFTNVLQQPVSVFLRLGKGKRSISRSRSPENRFESKRVKPATPSASGSTSKRSSVSKAHSSRPVINKVNRFDSFENWDNYRSIGFSFYSEPLVPKLQSFETSGLSSSSFDSRFPSPGYSSQPPTSFGNVPYQAMFNGYPIVRCAFFPHCSRPDCTFFHPEEECHYGDACPFFKECTYVHPSELVPIMCKFDDTCTRTDCFYHHVKRRHTVGKPDTFIPISCRTEGCVDPLCSFVHPGQKLPFAQDYCIFQARCNRPPCLRVHISEFRFKPPRKVTYVEDISKGYLDLFSCDQVVEPENIC